MNIPIEIISYIIGFLHADGNMYEQSRNRGRISIELSYRDKDILVKINKVFNNIGLIKDRTRDTNFRTNFKSSILRIHRKDIRDYLKTFGVNDIKAEIKMPNNINKKDYIRGYVDGNGSIGFTKKGFPFISITTPSKSLKESICNFFYKITEKQKNINPNTRDNIYNIIYQKEDAQKIASHLYENTEIFLNRKYNSYKHIMTWKRPPRMGARKSKIWSSEQDLYIQTNSIEKSMIYLKRSKSSIQTRLWRIKKSKSKIKSTLCL